MTDQPTVTERQAVERERAAFQRGALWFGALPSWFNVYAADEASAKEAAKVYPLPKVRRLREATIEGKRYRYSPTTRYWEMCDRHLGWTTWEGAAATGKVHILADLKANPWEEVDGD